MITIISPAKTMDFISETPSISTNPIFESEINELIDVCQNLEFSQIKHLMSVSDKIAEINYNRFQYFNDIHTQNKQAIYAFNGDVYQGIKLESFDKENIDFMQNNIRILSGLYGILRPLDMIKPYRLEMGIRLQNDKGKDLYEFWSDKITDYINKEIASSEAKFLVNLASNEYSSVINKKQLNYSVIDIIFKEYKKDKLKIVPINAKKARGIMTNFIIQNNINDPVLLKDFQESGYNYDQDLSSDSQYVFIKS